jgi:hypothetical protein
MEHGRQAQLTIARIAQQRPAIAEAARPSQPAHEVFRAEVQKIELVFKKTCSPMRVGEDVTVRYFIRAMRRTPISLTFMLILAVALALSVLARRFAADRATPTSTHAPAPTGQVDGGG